VSESRLNDDRRTIGRDVSRADVWYPAFDPPQDESYLSGGMGLSDIGEQGCSPKKEVKQDLDKDFLNNLGLHTCCTEITLHCVSVSN